MEGLISKLEKLIQKLPPSSQKELTDFAEFLFEKGKQKQGRILRQDWAGALSDYSNQYTSLELQKKSLEWRGD